MPTITLFYSLLFLLCCQAKCLTAEPMMDKDSSNSAELFAEKMVSQMVMAIRNQNDEAAMSLIQQDFKMYACSQTYLSGDVPFLLRRYPIFVNATTGERKFVVTNVSSHLTAVSITVEVFDYKIPNLKIDFRLNWGSSKFVDGMVHENFCWNRTPVGTNS